MGVRYRLGRWYGLGGEGGEIWFSKTLSVKYNVRCLKAVSFPYGSFRWVSFTVISSLDLNLYIRCT
jgi:hypothetical protein